MDAPKKMAALYAVFTPCLHILSNDNGLVEQKDL
jgi:hypothetical protein